MNEGNFKIILKSTTLLLILVFMISSCTQNSSVISGQTSQNIESHWFVDERGYFHTNDVKLAQKEIPFTIVVPDYIPSLFKNDYLYEITGPFENMAPRYTEVKIQITSEPYQIYISEYNLKNVMIPNNELNPMYYEIAGINVIRQTTGFLTSSGRIEGLSYSWNTDHLTFRVKTFNITDDEGLKVVESMVKQVE